MEPRRGGPTDRREGGRPPFNDTDVKSQLPFCASSVRTDDGATPDRALLSMRLWLDGKAESASLRLSAMPIGSLGWAGAEGAKDPAPRGPTPFGKGGLGARL